MVCGQQDVPAGVAATIAADAAASGASAGDSPPYSKSVLSASDDAPCACCNDSSELRTGDVDSECAVSSDVQGVQAAAATVDVAAAAAVVGNAGGAADTAVASVEPAVEAGYEWCNIEVEVCADP